MYSFIQGDIANQSHFILHYENMPIQIYWKFYHQQMKIFR